jgi:aspartate/methionine/tyrosine aminotransferase
MRVSASHPIARSAKSLQPFLAMEVMERAFELEREGHRIAHLEIGEPDFAAPPAAVRACQRALEAGETRYTDSRGLLELRQAIAMDAGQRFGVSIDPARVLVTSGTSPGMLLVFSLLLDPGDEVVMGDPHYPCYPNFVRQAGGVPVAIPTRAEEGYRLDPDAVSRALSPRTRAIVVSSPANPTGAVQSAQTMRALGELAREHGLALVSDEIYDGLVYDGVEVTSAHGLCDDAFVLDGFSKRYAMTGFRLGWLIAPEWALRPLQTMQQNFFISANGFVQRAGIAALCEGAARVHEMCRVYAGRRGRLVSGLRELGFDIPQLPEGAFYVLAGAQRFGHDSRRLAFDLLERAHVGVTPGSDFGERGEGMLRFCYAVSEATIDLALARLADELPRLAKRDCADRAVSSRPGAA